MNCTKAICFVCALWTATAMASPALGQVTFTTLADFSQSTGEYPGGSLVQARDGNFYGTTSGSGTYHLGTVFKITPDGALTALYTFCSQTGCADGSGPSTGLVLGTDGNLYGATGTGGADHKGTAFKITLGGTLTTLYSFCSQTGCADGGFPRTPVEGSGGNYYGTTTFDGASGKENTGTVFKITPSGTLTTLHSFCVQTCTDGQDPRGRLVLATDGNFYGTTYQGGAYEGGTVFKITPSGTLTTLYSFCAQTSCTDGDGPIGGLVQASDGNFYGTTNAGGAYKGGTVFKMTRTGTLTTLYSFCAQANCPDGQFPFAGLMQATDGNFYGTTEYGGDPSCVTPNGTGCGTVFKITAAGTLTTLYTFTDTGDGYTPGNGLVQGTDGSFYGTTGGDGDGPGTVFNLSVGLGPFVITVPTSGKVGSAVKILGTTLTGATSVSFNGTAAAFTVVSSTEISTTVPAGATTGTVTVATPSGTLLSNVVFRVTQ